jgi:hypothetical protein
MRIFLSGPAKGRNEFAGTGAMPKIDDPVEALERCGMGPRTVVIAIALLWRSLPDRERRWLRSSSVPLTL